MYEFICSAFSQPLFCHEDKNKESQPEDMGNDACIMIEYHARVNYCYLQQYIPIWIFLFHHLEKFIISTLYLRIGLKCGGQTACGIEAFKPKRLQNKTEKN